MTDDVRRPLGRDGLVWTACCAFATIVGGLVILSIGMCAISELDEFLLFPVYLSERVIGVGRGPALLNLAIGAIVGYGIPWGTALWAVVRRIRFKP